LCDCEDQRWRRKEVLRFGVSALSGVLLRKGEYIFKPTTRGDAVAATAGAMILASALVSYAWLADVESKVQI
jgi:hypothetical protein